MGKTVSVVINDGLADEFQRAVEVDAMPAANVAARAIDLYALLPATTRRGLGFVRDHGTVEEQDALFVEVARAVARARYVVATRQIRDALEQEALTISPPSTSEPMPEPPQGPAVPMADHADGRSQSQLESGRRADVVGEGLGAPTDSSCKVNPAERGGDQDP
jgi:hypothetical protein